jgi:hypothetical protein
MPYSGNRFHDPDTTNTPWTKTRRTSALLVGASLMLVSAATGCYQPGAYGYATTPVGVQATVTAPEPIIDAQVSAPVMQAQVSAPIGVQVAPAPDLITISPDVQVIANYQEPIFFTDGFYWRETDRGWYRSTSYNNGWSYHADAPYRVRNIENRGSYRNYRPSGYTPRSTYADHRGYNNRGYDARPRGGYDRPATSSYDRPATSTGWDRPGYQPRPRGTYDRPNTTAYDQPRPSSGYTSPRTNSYDRPAGYNPQPRNGYNGSSYNRPANTSYDRPAGYNPQPRNGYNGSSYNRPSTGYNAQPRNAGYNKPAAGYQPRASQPARSYDRPARSSQPARSYSSGGGRRSNRR